MGGLVESPEGPAHSRVQLLTSIAQRLNTFDFLRLLAATAVVIAHSKKYLGASFLAGPADVIDGVAVFFVISGLFVYRSAERTRSVTGGWLEFLRNRFLRIAPALYAYTIVFAALLVVLGVIGIGALLTKGVFLWFGGTLFFVPNHDPSVLGAFGTGNLNPSLYTIPAEVSFYIIVPVLYLLARRIGFNRMLLTLLPLAIAGPLVAHEAGGTLQTLLQHTFLVGLAYFGMGVLWSRYWERAPRHWLWFLGAAATYVALREVTPRSGDLGLYPVLTAPFLSYAVVWFGYSGFAFLHRFTETIGDLSFGTFIWHMPVINYFLWKGWTGDWWLVPCVLGISSSFALASWWSIERPALLHKRVSERVAETGEKVPGERQTVPSEAIE